MSTPRTRYQAALAAVVAVTLAWAFGAQGAEDGLLTGTVKSASGAPLEGVAISAQVAGEPITTSVYTGADGAYFFPPMKGNKYKVWAQAIGLERAEATADVGSKPLRLDSSCYHE